MSSNPISLSNSTVNLATIRAIINDQSLRYNFAFIRRKYILNSKYYAHNRNAFFDDL